MDTGAIFKVGDFSYNIERLNIGPRIDNISNIFVDNKSNRYFADNYFRRSGEVSYNYNGSKQGIGPVKIGRKVEFDTQHYI